MEKHFLDAVLTKIPVPLEEARKFANYCVIGATCAALDFVVFTVLTSAYDWNWFFANCISITAGIVTSFLLNVQFNFKTRDRYLKRFVSFFTTGMLGLVLASLVIFISHDVYEMNTTVSKLLSIVIITIFQYTLNRAITFRAQ